ncbi:glucose 1-dehydrogenase [Streptomyces sp. NPDC096057]|uniref:SDR family NAD(P)-dependent oxidoreductase n=1 Tax=Streptomyces sp. NPDC096057 TaxID=3155543 RepID=UPI00331D9AAB
MTYEPASFIDLAGKTVAVTGAARGIGAAHVLALVSNGVNVIAGDLDGDAMTATARDLGTRCRMGARIAPMRVDVTRVEEHSTLAQRALQEFGGLHGLINNAGTYALGDALSMSATQMDRMYRVHVLGSTFGLQAAVAAMGEAGGAIVNTTSIAAYVVRAGSSAYSASKAALDHLTRFQAVELGPRGVRVNAVAPGMVDTDMLSSITATTEQLRAAAESIPLRRVGTPGDIADAALFLLSDASRWITGHTLVVDGGGRHR